jgi:pimeloyl-ACP methyl ester carboxylesterase
VTQDPVDHCYFLHYRNRQHLHPALRAQHWVDLEDLRFVARFEKSFADAMRQLVSAAMFVPGSDPELRNWIVEDMASAPPDAGIGALRATLRWHSTSRSEALAALPAPVRLINSTLFPTNAAALESYGMEAVVMSDVGHFLTLEDAEGFNSHLSSAIEQFMD